MGNPRKIKCLALLLVGTLALSGCAEVVRERIVTGVLDGFMAGVMETFKLGAMNLLGTAFGLPPAA